MAKSTTKKARGKTAKKKATKKAPRKKARPAKKKATKASLAKVKTKNNAKSREAKQQAFKKKAATAPRRKPLALEIDPDVLEFIDAIERFKKSHARPFPSWSEILYVVRDLGYSK